MDRTFAALAPAAMLCCAALCGGMAHAADATVAPPPSPPDAVEDQVVVKGRAVAELRHRIEIAQDAFYGRFNDINSDDRFDVRCSMEATLGSRIEHRSCAFNGWREEQANYAAGLVGELRGEMGEPPEVALARQYAVAKEGADEMRRLSATDPILKQELLRLGQAYLALEAATGSRPDWTLFREVPAGGNGLPFGAQHMFDVRVGLDPWMHPLNEHTFTLTSVTGKIRSLRVECDHGRTKLSFKDDVEWTLPSAWGACMLTVSAKRATTFKLIEFQ
jgi:hypothetical protein